MTKHTATAPHHVTATRYVRAYGEWLAECRCGWVGSYLRTQQASQREADEHLAAETAD